MRLLTSLMAKVAVEESKEESKGEDIEPNLNRERMPEYEEVEISDKKFKRAYEEFRDRHMQEVKDDYPGLKLS